MINLKNRVLKIIFGLGFFGSLLFGTLLVINLIPSKVRVDSNILTETKFIKLTEFKSYRGHFMALRNNLERVDILFKNPNLESRDELKIIVISPEKTIYEQKFSGFNFGDTSRARLDFTPLGDSDGKKYTINIIPTKIVDGKLSVGVISNNLDIIEYYDNPSNILRSFDITLVLMLNKIFIIPLVFLILFLW